MISNLEKNKQKLRNEIIKLKNGVNTLGKKYKNRMLSIEKKYEDNHKKLDKLIKGLGKVID